MNDHLRPRPDNGGQHGGAIENVNDDWFDAGRLQRSSFVWGSRRADNSVPLAQQQRHQPSSDRAARSSKENPHNDRQ